MLCSPGIDHQQTPSRACGLLQRTISSRYRCNGCADDEDGDPSSSAAFQTGRVTGQEHNLAATFCKKEELPRMYRYMLCVWIKNVVQGGETGPPRLYAARGPDSDRVILRGEEVEIVGGLN